MPIGVPPAQPATRRSRNGQTQQIRVFTLADQTRIAFEVDALVEHAHSGIDDVLTDPSLPRTVEVGNRTITFTTVA